MIFTHFTPNNQFHLKVQIFKEHFHNKKELVQHPLNIAIVNLT